MLLDMTQLLLSITFFRQFIENIFLIMGILGTCFCGYTLMLHLMHFWPMLAHEFPDIHFRLHFGHLYSPKQRFFP